MKPNIFDYLDYRQYILDMAGFLNQHDPDFSFSRLAECIGSESPEFLRQIRDRQLNLDVQGVERLCCFFSLDNQQKEFFKSIVGFDQAQETGDKDRYLNWVRQTRQYPSIKQLDRNQYDYFSHWYMPVVRELVTSPGYRGDPQWIVRRVVPAINLEDVKEAINLLKTLKLIYFDEATGRWSATDQIVATTAQVQSQAAMEYHTDTIGLAREALRRFTSEERDIRSATLGLSQEGYQEVRRRMETFWKELLAFAQTETRTDQVFQINMQLFPMSTPPEETL